MSGLDRERVVEAAAELFRRHPYLTNIAVFRILRERGLTMPTYTTWFANDEWASEARRQSGTTAPRGRPTVERRRLIAELL